MAKANDTSSTPSARADATEVIAADGGGSITIPGGPKLLTAEFFREGDDLLIANQDGSQTVVSDYFAAAQPADLSTGAAVISGHTVGLFAQSLGATQVGSAESLSPLSSSDGSLAAIGGSPVGGLTGSAGSGEPIAELSDVMGEVVVIRADGARVAGHEGTAVYEDDIVTTGTDSSTGLRFVDEMTFSLGSDARMVLDEFSYEPEIGEGGGFFSILQGSFSFVSGEAAHFGLDSLQIETPTMTIGVRGTKVAVQAAAEGETSRIALLAEDDGTVGKIMVTTDAGSELISDANTMVEVVSRFQAPSAQIQLSSDQIYQHFGSPLSSLPRPDARPEGSGSQEGTAIAAAVSSSTVATDLALGQAGEASGDRGASGFQEVSSEASSQSGSQDSGAVSGTEIASSSVSGIANAAAAPTPSIAPAVAAASLGGDSPTALILEKKATTTVDSPTPGTAANVETTETVTTSTDQAATGQAVPASAAAATVTEVNDAPVLDNAGNPTLTAVAEDSASPAGNTVAEIVTDGSVTDLDGSPVEAIALTGADNTNGTWQYSTDGGTTFNAVGAVSDSAAILLNAAAVLRFVPNASYNGSAAIAYRAWDQSSGTNGQAGIDASVNGGATAFSAASETAAVTITGVNDAPVLDNSGTPVLTAVAVNAAAPAGNTVAQIVTDGSISDVDGSPVESIALTGADNSNGAWQYSTDGGATFNAVGAVSDNAAILLNSAAVLRFVPNASYNGSATLAYRAWDQSSGSNGQTGVDVSVNGGATAFSTAIETASVSVVGGVPSINGASSLDFAGTSSYVNAGDPGAGADTFDPKTGDVTVEAWFYFDGSVTDQETILSKGNFPHTQEGYSVFIENNTLVVRVNGTGSSAEADVAASSIALPANTGWYHVALVIDQGLGALGSSVTGYLNGSSAGWVGGYGSVADNLFTAPAGGIDTLRNFLIGATENNGGNAVKFFDSQIADVRVWSSAKSQAEIQTGLGETLAGNESSLIANWLLNEGSGSTLSDSVIGGTNASAVGGPAWQSGTTFTLVQDTVLDGRISASDPDGDNLTYSVSANAANGTATINASTGAWEYTPNGGYNGADGFSYQVSDGGATDTINIAVTVTP